MSDSRTLAGFAAPVLLFLKATRKKQVFIPSYTRHDGVVVPGHYTHVHVADDHDGHKILAGEGTHSQQKAHKVLSKHAWFQALSHDHKVHVLMEHATEIQDKASAAAVLSTFKKKVLAGQSPSAAEWKGFSAAPQEKKAALADEFAAAGKTHAFTDGLVAWQKKNPPAAAAPVPEPAAPAAPKPEGKTIKTTMDGEAVVIAPQPGGVWSLTINGKPHGNFMSSGAAQAHAHKSIYSDAEADTPVKAPESKPAPKVVAAAEKPAAAAPAPASGHPALEAHLHAIDSAKLPDSNSNALSVNKKLSAIAHATATGDVKTLLMMGYGSNNYGVKAAALANQSLALLGSTHKVAPGQKMASHPGMHEAPAAAPAAPTAPTPAPVAAKVEPEKKPAAESDADMAGWGFQEADDGFDGNPSIALESDTGTSLYVVKNVLEGGYQAMAMEGFDGAEPEFADFATAQEAALWLSENYDAKIPNAALKKLSDANTVDGMEGPKDGDTKQGADGPLVFKDGRWHKVGGEKPAQAPQTKMTEVFGDKFTHTEDGHSKFWSVGVAKTGAGGLAIVTYYGKIGAKGQQTVKPFAGDLEAAKKEIAKLKKQKAAKGYVSQGVSTFFAEVPVAGNATPAPKAAAPAAKPAPKVVAGKQNPAPSVESIDSWPKIGGQGGYNEGGTYVDPQGVQWYCKFPKGGEKIVRNELLASKLYGLAGVDTAETKMITQGGKVGIASKIVTGAQANKAALLAGKAPGLLSGFATDAWLANWDTVGNNPAKGYDNILIKPDGSAVRIDSGGALLYGGAGGKKQKFENDVIELKTMLDPAKNAHTAAVFGKMSPADIAASVAKVAAIDDKSIIDMCEKFGPGSMADRARLAEKLIARKASMLAQYPQAAKVAEKLKKAAAKPAPAAAKKPVVSGDVSWVKLKPGEKIVEKGEQFGGSFVKIEIPPKGFNAEGIPKPYVYDKSSSAFVNAANTADIKSVYDTALKTHDPAAVSGMTFEQIEKATGVKTGKMLTVDEHPSKAYVKEYVNQVAAELKAQTEPTYRVEHRGAFTSSYSAAAAQIASKVKTIAYAKFAKWKDKAADYLVLDKHAGTGIPTPQANAFHDVEPTDPQMVAFKAASDANFAALTGKEKQACKSYTGSAYWDWNSAMRLGTVDSAEFKAGEPMRKAFSKAAVDLPEGIILHRGLNVGGDTYKSVVGAVIQDGSFQSSSYGSKAAFSGKQSQLRLHITKGVKAMMATSFSNYGTGEREVILHPNCRYVVTNVETKNGKNVVDVLVLPHEE